MWSWGTLLSLFYRPVHIWAGQAWRSHTGWHSSAIFSIWRPVIPLRISEFRKPLCCALGGTSPPVVEPLLPSFPQDKKRGVEREAAVWEQLSGQRLVKATSLPTRWQKKFFLQDIQDGYTPSDHIPLAHQRQLITNEKQKTAWAVRERGGTTDRSNFFADLFFETFSGKWAVIDWKE